MKKKTTTPRSTKSAPARSPAPTAKKARAPRAAPAAPRAARAPGTRLEHDSLGELQVPADALWAAQTQRAVENFPLSGLRMPRGFLRALGLLKASAAEANAELGLLPADTARAITSAALEVAAGEHDAHFPVDVFQTGSGTSSNMNANEVIATLASRRAKKAVHPNDHVNLGQSSNDVIPSALLASAALEVDELLLPALEHLEATIDRRAKELARVVKTGRTHLMDAMPLTFGQELSGWASLVRSARARFEDTSRRLRLLPLGGTAVGTGINAHPAFAKKALALLSARTKQKFSAAPNAFHGLSHPDAAVELAGQLSAYATSLTKVANDLRWMNSGPLAGLGEIELPTLQPGSSIMPGKVNPVIPEAVLQIAAQVVGNSTTITWAGASGNFELNVMLPVIAYNLLQSIELLASGSRALADRAISGFVVRADRVEDALARNPILVTALNPVLGYEKSAALAKRAYKEGRPILEVALESSELSEERLKKLLDPEALTRGGIAAAPQSSKRAGSQKTRSAKNPRDAASAPDNTPKKSSKTAPRRA